jgi:hypothetical protein
MIRQIARVGLLGCLLLSASCGLTWTGRSDTVEAEAAERGVKDVGALEAEYESQRYWGFWRRNLSGKWNSFLDGLHHAHESFDRNFMNYSWNDPRY